MSKYVRLAAVAAAAATAFVAPTSASAACWQMGPAQRVVNVPTPWGAAYVDLPVWVDTNPGHCISDARSIVPVQTEDIKIEDPPVR